jgi:hypothetical protein
MRLHELIKPRGFPEHLSFINLHAISLTTLRPLESHSLSVVYRLFDQLITLSIGSISFSRICFEGHSRYFCAHAKLPDFKQNLKCPNIVNVSYGWKQNYPDKVVSKLLRKQYFSDSHW